MRLLSTPSRCLPLPLSTPSLVFYLILVVSIFSPVFGAHGDNARQMCKVKRKGSQETLVFPTPDVSPPSPLPTTTQELGSPPSSTHQDVASSATVAAYLPPFDYSTHKMRGVNLGGWFMMEPWITPSMFEKTGNESIIDEFTYGQFLDRDQALEMLHEHWATWYTEQDFIEIAAAGLNHVRLPISYWAVPLEQNTGPYLPGAWPYILQALDWARDHGLYVILDLHGVPGSQNGFDNSGQRTSNPTWALEEDNFNQALDVLETIAREIGDRVEVIQLMNELAGFRGQQWADAARQFWQAGYERVRAAAGDRVRVMIGDAFLGLDNWYGYMKAPQHGVLMDLHVYQVFSTDELRRSWQEHIDFMCNRIDEFVSYASNNLWLIMGEWSNASTDCAKYLNGRGIGARWDGTYPNTPYLDSCQGFTGNASTFSEEYKRFLRQYWEAQVTVAERANGWIYWTWKAENADDWSYKAGLEHGFIPRDPADRAYPNICG